MDNIKCDYCHRHNIPIREPQDGYIEETDEYICGQCWMIFNLLNLPEDNLLEMCLQLNPDLSPPIGV